MIDLTDRIVIVTGAAGGLGSAYVEALTEHGATVIAHDGGVSRDGTAPDASRIEAAVATWRARGLAVESEAQDLSTRAGCDDLIARVIARHDRIDALVHSAGIVRYGGIEQTTEAEWDRMMRINVDAAWWLCRAAWPHLRERGFGRIVLTTSAYGMRPYDGSDVTAYGVGKAAQFGLMNGLAGEGSAHGILVNAIEPIAATRIFRAAVDDGELSAAAIAPAVVALVAPELAATGWVVNAADGEFQLQRFPPSERVALRGADPAQEILRMLGSAS